ncbi:class I SAM-dependent methyltransferase [Saccharopolyspora taberi]|uniref:Class I SAM-dependent methyltransferase n=1 Tax=Saccharopolyspora taberi TaxID=60895 RepID=A0ABN3VD29_9PSEU
MSDRQAVAALARAYAQGTAPAELTGHVTGLESALHLGIRAHAMRDRSTAHHCATRAVRFDPGSEFARLLVRHTADDNGNRVYDSPAAFRAFIRGGGNIGLYEQTSAALRDAYRRHRPRRVLDIGVGDGLALLPALGAGGPAVDVVEPSAELLTRTRQELHDRGIEHRAWQSTIQDFAADHDEHGEGEHWDLVQSTYAMQSLPPGDRATVLSWIARHSSTFVLVEFDVPEVPSPWEPDWFFEFVRRVERGLREYTGDRDLVGLGFVLPVVLGVFGPGPRTNYELAIDGWQRELRAAGFTDVSGRVLHDYWWRPAHIVEARR